MLDIAEELHRWVEQGREFAVATVVATNGSAPRQPGAALAVDSDGTAIGSVSGGCVEGAVYDLCQEALRTGEPVLERFGYSDEDAFAVGLTCGGIIDIFVQPVRTSVPRSAGERGSAGERVERTADTLAAGLTAAAPRGAAAGGPLLHGPPQNHGRAPGAYKQ
ncbi:XdhC family protein, partial [Streptomyces inhibens]|uniref:XdhC family protein n=1 Tax=Streptomyces inhibens TaxID=2293571 RepID=UPI0036938743